MSNGQPIDVQLPAVPDHIPQPALQSICQTLGMSPGSVRELRISLGEVTATLLLHNSDGNKIRYGDDAATTTVTIPVR